MTFHPSRIIAGVMNWGVWGASLGTSDIAVLIKSCISEGVFTFDHADIYGGHTTEEEFGRATKKIGLDRNDYQLITKCGIMMPSRERPHIKEKHYNTSKDHIVKSVERSLSNLNTDYIDLLLVHRPSPLMDPNEINEAITDLKASGKVLHFGVSNFKTSQVSLLKNKTPIAANQIELSPFALKSFVDGDLDYSIENEILPMAWSPIGGGKLFGKLADSNELEKREKLTAIAKKYGWELDFMIYLWLLHHPAQIYPVVGSSKIDRIKTGVKATKETISDAQWFEIYTACLGRLVD